MCVCVSVRVHVCVCVSWNMHTVYWPLELLFCVCMPSFFLFIQCMVLFKIQKTRLITTKKNFNGTRRKLDVSESPNALSFCISASASLESLVCQKLKVQKSGNLYTRHVE